MPNRGTFDIYVKCDGVGRCVGNYDNRGSFGELALMYNTPRAATITATSPGALWGLVSEPITWPGCYLYTPLDRSQVDGVISFSCCPQQSSGYMLHSGCWTLGSVLRQCWVKSSCSFPDQVRSTASLPWERYSNPKCSHRAFSVVFCYLCFPKCGPPASSICITWVLARNGNSEDPTYRFGPTESEALEMGPSDPCLSKPNHVTLLPASIWEASVNRFPWCAINW